MQLDSSFSAQIDKYRGVFALMVMFGHAIDVAARGQTTHDYLYPILVSGRLFFGFVWVVGFIVLSGFCIHSSCMRAERFSFRRYMIQRATRIYPLLLSCVVLTLILEAIMYQSEFRPTLWYFGLLDGAYGVGFAFVCNMHGLGGFIVRFGSIAPAYTISYELLFYTFWGISLCMFGRKYRNGLLSNVAIVAIAILAVHTFATNLPLLALSVFDPLILMLYLAWLIGAAVATYLEVLANIRFVRSVCQYAWGYLLVVAVIGFEQGMPKFDHSLPCFPFYVALGLGFAMLIVDAKARTNNACVRHGHHLFGELSYPLYLVHGPIIVYVGYLLNLCRVELSFTIYLAILTCSAILAAGSLVVAIERPVMRFRKRVSMVSPPAHEGAGSGNYVSNTLPKQINF